MATETVQMVYAASGEFDFDTTPDRGMAPLTVKFTPMVSDPNIQMVYGGTGIETWSNIYG